MMLCNGEITMILEKLVPSFRFVRTSHIVTNSWKIKPFPNPVGKRAITSLPLKRWRIASSYSFFNVKVGPDSLSFKRTSLQHDSKLSISSAMVLVTQEVNKKYFAPLSHLSITVCHTNHKPPFVD